MNEITSKDALKFFNEHGYLVINSMRGSDKTNVLRDIIESHLDKYIGIVCPTVSHYHKHFNIYQYCEFIPPSNGFCGLQGRRFDIVLGDEVYIEPSKEFKTASVMTRQHVEFLLYPDKKVIDRLNELKYNLPTHAFEIDFGQFLDNEFKEINELRKEVKRLKNKYLYRYGDLR